MYKDTRESAAYVAEHAMKTSGQPFNVFKGWADAKLVLKYYYGAKTFEPHELALRKVFVDSFKRKINNEIIYT